MKREIKFGGKSIYDVEWLYGSLIKIEEDRYAIIPDLNDIEIGNSIGIYEVDPITIGQFTGLRDKNRIEIYEGDIIRWRRDGKLYLVKFYAGMFYASVEELNKGVYGGFPLHVLTVDEEDGYKCEVCGNIYDNPELLKGCSHE
nr:MAG TPA: YopX protein [Bacteriophage sp.]